MSAKLQVGATLVDPASWRPKKSQFFIEDAELVILKVEDTLFKVHRFFLQRDSEVFHGMFSCPPGKGGAEGKTEARPIVLEQVTVFEFECLIDFIYNGMYHSTPAERTSKQWIALLSISSRYLFDKIRMQSIRALQSMASGIDAVERIVLSQQFDIQDWLKPALAESPDRENQGETPEATA
ncbi:hypothetical protein CERSUDRAFT_95106 [Gelatoporia subvermispora B]|uniref:BTB domain-containing protein n=1 Tax=Ceriporiopsis subvermispora (strain B) TaxID=914234 RepID=M2RDC8_CERS8|nr:hypothetical protein CERSUDRAFT_95106 [Gelatoporia subvermispora B]